MTPALQAANALAEARLQAAATLIAAGVTDELELHDEHHAHTSGSCGIGIDGFMVHVISWHWDGERKSLITHAAWRGMGWHALPESVRQTIERRHTCQPTA